MPAASYPTIGGAHSDSTLLARALAARGVTNPLTKQPYSEAMIFGLGGGLGGMYFVWEMCGYVHLTVGGRYWSQDNVKFVERLGRTLGCPLPFQQPGGKKAAQAALDAILASGRSAIFWADHASLPYHHLPEAWKKGLIHTAAVVGTDKAGNYLIDDRAKELYTISPEDLAEARQTQPYMKARLLDIGEPAKAVNVGKAVQASVNAMIEYSLSPPIKNFGLPAFEKWAELIIHTKDKKGWPTVMAKDQALFSALVGAYESVESDTGGGMMRPLYADFLAEAGKLTKNKAMAALEKDARALGADWTAFAEASLPDSHKWCKEAKQDLKARNAARSVGPKGEKDLIKANEGLNKLRESSGGQAPKGFREKLYPELSERMYALHAAEVDFMTKLASAV